MHERAGRLKAGWQGLCARKNTVLIGRQITQHQGHARFVKILCVVGGHPHTHCAGPIFHHGQFLLEVRQNSFGVIGVEVGDVQQT